MLKGLGGMLGGHHEREPPATAGPELATFEEQIEKEQIGQDQQTPTKEHPVPPVSPGGSLARRFGTLLGGVRGDDGRRHGTKRISILGRLSPRPSGDGTDHEKGKDREHPMEVDETGGWVHARGDEEKENETLRNGTVKAGADGKMVQSQSLPVGQAQPTATIHRRAATILDPQGRGARHERRSSAGAALFSGGGTIGRNRRPSTSGTMTGARKGDHPFGRTEEEELAEQDEIDEIEHPAVLTDDEQGGSVDKEFKPVFLKGLFRCVALCLRLLCKPDATRWL